MVPPRLDRRRAGGGRARARAPTSSAEVDDEPLLIARGRDGELRAFYNVCRHRGTAVVEEPCGKAVRFQCPYHAWIYDLEGKLVRAKHTDDLDDFSFEEFGLVPVRMETWQGFVFVNLAPEAPPLVEWLGDLPPHLARFDFSGLRVAHTVTYEVDSNWKFIAENYSECYHCPGIHPQLNKLTPYDLGGDFAPDGPWQGGWMELVENAETMAIDGGHRDGRPAMAGMTPVDERRIYYYLIWPTTFISIHPDYLLVHRLEPAGADHTRIVCQWLFEPATIAMPGFDPSDAIEFWDLTNRQDWHVCELQQRGTRSRQLGRRPLLEPGAERPRVRPDGRRPLCQRRHQLAAHGPPPLRRPDAEGRRGDARCCRRRPPPAPDRHGPTGRRGRPRASRRGARVDTADPAAERASRHATRIAAVGDDDPRIASISATPS